MKKVLFILFLMIIMSVQTAYSGWCGTTTSASSAASRTNTNLSIDKDKPFGLYGYTGFKSDSLIEETVETLGAGAWYELDFAKKYGINLSAEGFTGYEGWQNDFLKYGGTLNVGYKTLFTVPFTYTIYDYDKGQNQGVLEGTLIFKY